jgi:hypothetical protein
MVYFKTKNPIPSEFWRVLQLNMLVYFINIWSIFRPFGIFYGHLVYFPPFWYIFTRFGMLYQEKSGNPALLLLLLLLQPFPVSRHQSVSEFVLRSQPGLPDGLFSYQKYQYLYIFKGIGVKHVW